MHSAAGFRGRLAVLVIEMAVMAVMAVPTARGAPVSLDRHLSGGGDWKSLPAMQSGVGRPGQTVPSDSSPERREKFLKILTFLEELQRSINGSMSGRIVIVPRGNKSNLRGAGKKKKVVVSEEAQRVSTLPPVDGGGTAPGPSDRPPEPQNRGGKDFKKSIPQSPKKPNKRVCFWKYCSQN